MMERCPNCGTPARPGAKFCTTCGFRFPGDASDGESGNGQTDTTTSTIDEEPGLFPGAMTDGWPSPPQPAEVVRSDWEEASGPAAPASAEPGETIEVEAASDSWTTGAVDSWPARPDVPPADTSQVEPEPQEGETSETLLVGASDPTAGDQARAADAVARAMRLLEELRDTISEIGPQSAVDLSGIISELEVAVNPPGAMPPDDVAELRDALVTARERPRDVDTILDLTTRIDAMLALVIAYDRTIAAIERSLEALRGDG
jgi:zinc ribbon protein